MSFTQFILAMSEYEKLELNGVHRLILRNVFKCTRQRQ